MNTNLFKTAKTCLAIYGSIVLAERMALRYLERHYDELVEKLAYKLYQALFDEDPYRHHPRPGYRVNYNEVRR